MSQFKSQYIKEGFFDDLELAPWKFQSIQFLLIDRSGPFSYIPGQVCTSRRFPLAIGQLMKLPVFSISLQSGASDLFEN
jgi:hypothetical protein